MRPVLVVVAHILRHQPLQMPLIQDDHVVQQVSSAAPTQRSATPFCHGLRKAEPVGWLPMSLTAETTSLSNLESRSNNRNLGAGAYGHASLICCTIQRALGFRVTLTPGILRRSWPMTKKQYRTPEVSVGTVKKSIAAICLVMVPEERYPALGGSWISRDSPYQSRDRGFRYIETQL